jgi:archaemetzincin
VPEARTDGRIDPADRRASSDALLDALIKRYEVENDPKTRWILGVTAHDLFAPDKPCVFGEATLGGHWAVVGIARFGIPTVASPRLSARALKESLHEIGHLAGLPHCDDPQCPLARAATVAEIDRKKADFCGDCRRQFHSLVSP